MKMNIVLILLISINGITCLEDGLPIDSLENYSNSIVVIWEYGPADGEPCSGTVISLSHIVTPGFCLDRLRSDEIYVTARAIDPSVMRSVLVHHIHRYQNLKKVYDHRRPEQELWLHNIAILELVGKLPWYLDIAPMPLNYQRWNHTISLECYTVGYHVISPRRMIPQWSTVVIAPNTCFPSESIRLPHEVFAISTTLATFTFVDTGISLIHNGTAIGMIVQGVENPETVAVLIYAFYQDFIEYILAGGVVEIGESAVHVVVAIFESGKFVCGGFAVHNRYVVTAAHCVDGKEKANLLVAFSHVEIPRMNPASEWSSVERIVIHPLYSPIHAQNLEEHSSENNIAVLKLRSDLPWNPLIRLKDLPDPEFISSDRPCEILRWTDPPSGDTESKILMRSYVTVYDRNNGLDLRAEEFRADGIYYLPIATDNDIGNPIIFENNIIGMVIEIRKNIMDPVVPVMCLKIRPYEAFIKKVIDRT